MKRIAFVGVLLMLAPPAEAKHEVTPEYLTCERTAKGHWANTQCLADEVDRQKALLGIEYKALLRETDARDKAALEKAQKAWITFRDLDCQAKADAIDHAGGNGAWDASVSCLVQHLLLRRDQLSRYWAL